MKHTVLIVMFSLALLVAGASIVGYQFTDEQVSAQTTCATSIGTITQPGQSEIVQGTRLVEFASSNEVKQVRFLFNNKIIGKGFRDPNSTGYQWRMAWDTRFVAAASNNIPGDLKAEVTLQNNVVCYSNPKVSIMVNVFEPLPLIADIEPPSYSGYTNSSTIFEIKFPPQPSGSTTVDIARYADVKWELTGRGQLLPQPYAKVKYTTGSDSGTGSIRAIIHYGGQEIVREIAVSVQSLYESPSSSEDSTSPTTTSPTNNTTQQSTVQTSTQQTQQQTTQIAPAEAITQVLQQDEFTNSCINNVLGEDALRIILEQNRRPRGNEFEKFLSCFARQNYVIPSILAPVAPEDVSRATESRDVRIGHIASAIKQSTNGNTEQTVLILSGQSIANSKVLLYIFSEPLVLATTADENGDWSYSLEDPLESGEHEVYALVDKGDGEYQRSSVANFVIGRADATEENPNGYSLQLISEPTIAPNNRSVNVLVAATVGTVLLTGLILGVFFAYRAKKRRLQSQANQVSIDENDHNYRNYYQA